MKSYRLICKFSFELLVVKGIEMLNFWKQIDVQQVPLFLSVASFYRNEKHKTKKKKKIEIYSSAFNHLFFNE